MPESASGGGFCSRGVCAPGGCLVPGVSGSRGVSAPEGCLVPGGVCSGGVPAPRGGFWSWGGVCVCSGGGIPACTEADTPPLWTESQTPVKTLPWPNFVAAGN